MSKLGLIVGILFVVPAAVAFLAGCKGPSRSYYRTPNPSVEGIRNCDYPEPDTSSLDEQRRQEREEMLFRRY